MITERWEHYEREIGLIDMGYHCSLYPEFATRVAVMVLRNQMEREKLRTAARLDDTLKSADYISRGIAEGKAAAKNGECDRLSTEAQARLRALVADLVNLAADQ
jgi:hypothetical protein